MLKIAGLHRGIPLLVEQLGQSDGGKNLLAILSSRPKKGVIIRIAFALDSEMQRDREE